MCSAWEYAPLLRLTESLETTKPRIQGLIWRQMRDKSPSYLTILTKTGCPRSFGITSQNYVSLTVHLGIILVNDQIDSLFSTYLFISLLYMFRATQCSSSGESNYVNTSFGIYHSVQVTAWYARQDLTGIPGSHLHRVIYTRWCIDTIRFSWWWALGCSKHVEKWNK